jgi:hypothetical protein
VHHGFAFEALFGVKAISDREGSQTGFLFCVDFTGTSVKRALEKGRVCR